MLPWLVVGIIVVTVFVVMVLRDAIADDRRRKLDKVKKNYAGY
jgi:hypothetical protein